MKKQKLFIRKSVIVHLGSTYENKGRTSTTIVSSNNGCND
jgi:hypothetical protein